MRKPLLRSFSQNTTDNMAIFDFLKRKELSEIATLKQSLVEASSKIASLQELNGELEPLRKYSTIRDVELEGARLKLENEELIRYRNIILDDYNKSLRDIQHALDILDDEVLLQTFGIYTPLYDFQKLDEYKEKLDEIRDKQKTLIRNKEAGKSTTNWIVDGSVAKGRAQTNQQIKQLLRCFNVECDLLIDKVKFNNIDAYIQKIRHTAEQLNKINERSTVYLTEEYINLKIEELRVAYEYAKKKQEEKDRIAEIRKMQKEEERVRKELEEARKDIVKEQLHYNNALKDILDRLGNGSSIENEYLLEKKTEIENHLGELDQKLKDIDYREANKRAGYVYIISNIGSFGENVYKIGMTRRLNPMERVDELGDASVPFKFDVHALIFSDDAPSLETALHHAFEDRKVNMVNARREFYRVTLEEIEDVVKSNYDKTVEFVKIPQAEQYRESLRLYDTASSM